MKASKINSCGYYAFVPRHSEGRESNIPAIEFIKTLAGLDGFNSSLIGVQFQRLEHSCGGVPLAFEVQEFLRLVGRLVRGRLPQLYGLWKGFVHVKRTSWPLFPNPTRAAYVEVGVIHGISELRNFL